MKDKEKNDKTYLALVQKYESKLDEKGNESDWDSEDDEDEPEVLGYHCLCCGNTQPNNSFGGMCNTCCAYSLEEITF